MKLTIKYLVDKKKIVIVYGKFSMPHVTRFGLNLSKRSHQNQKRNESDSSSMSASNVKYPFLHMCHYLRIKDESLQAPSRTDAEAVSIKECCKWIRDVLMNNNFSDNYQYHLPISWLDYYKISLAHYQKYIPDNRNKSNIKKMKPLTVHFNASSESELESSDDDHIPSVEEEDQSRAQRDAEREVNPITATLLSSFPPVNQQSVEEIQSKSSPVLNLDHVPPSMLMTPKPPIKQSMLGTGVKWPVRVLQVSSCKWRS